MQLWNPISEIPGVGEATEKKLTRLGINTVFDLVYHLPFRYEDRSHVTTILETQIGETTTIIGRIEELKNVFTKRGKALQLGKVSDATGSINVVWFNQTFLTKNLHIGDTVSLYGKISDFSHKKSIVSPKYSVDTENLTAIYPETAGLTSKWLSTKIKTILASISPDTGLHTEALPEIHFPKSLDQAEKARQKLAFDELLLLHLTSLYRKQTWQQTQLAHVLAVDQTKVLQFMAQLPFNLTSSQTLAINEILTDLQHTHPMNRLLLGDVGSGKTIVAAIAAYICSLNGLQTLILAPTQILATQHFNTLSVLFKPFGLEVGLVTANSKLKIKNLKFEIVVGTQALLSKSLQLTEIGLVVIDEQHRFGVTQRTQAIALGKSPHVLTMTATPIPRTVALATYGDLDQSVLTDMPTGRKPVKTWVVPEAKRISAYAWIADQITVNKSQAFVVCPFVEESETLTSVKSAKAEFEILKKTFPTLKLGLLHGKLKSNEKEQVLDKFRDHKLDILVTTPVVEVGVDIPNATIMVVEAAERFGLAGLHQLRGRVGRGVKDSYCLLFANTECPRLKSLETMHSGAELAEADFQARGPGQIYGTTQHGHAGFKIASYQDLSQLEPARKRAVELFPCLDDYPTLRSLVKTGKIEIHDSFN